MSDLAARSCVPCRGGHPPLTAAEIEPLAAQVPEWAVIDGHHLERSFDFRDFERALAFVNRVGGVAEAENHHPDLHLGWGRVRVEIWTHKVDGLTESDFVFAAKCDREHHPEPQPLAQAWRAPDPAVAHLLAGYLESRGIAAVVRGEELFAGEGSVLPQEAGPTIWVPADRAQEAKDLLNEHQRNLASEE